MLIVLNIGNTHIQAGVFKEHLMIATGKLSSRKTRTPEVMGQGIMNLLKAHGVHPGHVSGMALCSVVPSLTRIARRMGKKYFHIPPFVILPGVNTPILIKCAAPRSVGSDRIANAVAGHKKYKTGLIIIDCGTATTVDYISSKGDFMGGAIAPGIEGLADILHVKTARLPRIDIAPPDYALGKDTISAMKSGVFYGYLGLVEGLTQRIRKEARERTRVVATGGAGRLVAETSETIRIYDEFLTLEGAKHIYDDTGHGVDFPGGMS